MRTLERTGRGRRPLPPDVKKCKMLFARCTREEYERFYALAHDAELTLSEWARLMLVLAADRLAA